MAQGRLRGRLAQETWFKADLAAHATAATNNIIVVWHKPRSRRPRSTETAAHADLVAARLRRRGGSRAQRPLAQLQRFAPMNATGAADPTAFGMLEVVVGTGGAGAHGFTTPATTSLVRNSGTAGVLVLASSASFDWQFVPVPGKTFTDAGTRATRPARLAQEQYVENRFGRRSVSTLCVSSTHLACLAAPFLLAGCGGSTERLGKPGMIVGAYQTGRRSVEVGAAEHARGTAEGRRSECQDEPS